MRLNSVEANAHYDILHGEPIVLEKDNDGSYIFRFNIKPEFGKQGNEQDPNESEIQIGWECREIRIFGSPTKANLKKAIIRSLVDETMEFDLINSYYKHILEIEPNEDAVNEYKEFLQFTCELDSLLSSSLTV